MSSQMPPLSPAEMQEATRLGLFGFPVPAEIARVEPGRSASPVRLFEAEIARQRLKQRLALAERIAATAPDLPGAEHDVADTHFRLGNAALILDELTGAGHHFSAATAIAEKLMSRDPGNASYRYQAIYSLVFLASIAVDCGRSAEGVRLCTRAEELFAPLAQQGASRPDITQSLAEIRAAATSRSPGSPGRRDPNPPGWAEPRPDDAQTFSGLFDFFGD